MPETSSCNFFALFQDFYIVFYFALFPVCILCKITTLLKSSTWLVWKLIDIVIYLYYSDSFLHDYLIGEVLLVLCNLVFPPTNELDISDASVDQEAWLLDICSLLSDPDYLHP